MTPSARRTLFLLLLFVGTLVLYREAAQLEFLSYDDDTYVTDNQAVQAGLTARSVGWAFTSNAYACNWHPLTWISHMADVSLFGGANAGAHHMTNVILHGFNAVLLVLLISRLSGRFVCSWFVGALFAWHPQRVESVAWISERKDVLAILFGLSSLLVFYRWVHLKEDRARPLLYGLALLLFACGLMAKPLLVTLPGCMLLLDRWPRQRALSLGAALLEKAPFLVLSLGACLMTLWSQSNGGCTGFISDGLSGLARLENAAITCAQYAGLMLYPKDLVVFYPHPAVLDPELGRSVAALAAGLGILALLALGWKLRKRAPYLFFGCLWFLGVLAPMLGLIQVGGQAMADRYTYFSTIGLVLPIVFGLGDLAAWRPRLRLPIWSAGCIALGFYAYATHAQIPIWKNDSSLFGHATQLNERNYIAQNALGSQDAIAAQRALQAGESEAGLQLLASAVERLELACSSNPRHFEARVDLGAARILLGQPEQARIQLEIAIELRPHDDNAHFQLALAYYNLQEFNLALKHLQIIRQRNPGYAKLERLAQAVASAQASAQRTGH